MAADPYKYFRVEAAELVGALASGLLELERTGETAAIATVLRHAHTLKGAARIVKHKVLADLAHALEEELAPLRAAPEARRQDGALAIVDRMTAQLATLAPVAAPVAVAEAPRQPSESVATPRIDTPPIQRIDSDAIDDALGGLTAIAGLVGKLRLAVDRAHAAQLLDAVDRELREIRRDVEHVRLAAAGSLFPALERTARDAALAGGRQIVFEGSGGDVRLDSQVLGALHAALVQLVRNAVAHGIEAPARRVAAGKPERGRIAIAVRSLGRRIAITCEDDGNGLDVDAIRRAAEVRGIETEQLAPSDLFQLLLRGGITTSRQVTELAGRGIGLDVVRDTVRELGGEVGARSQAGIGTTITLVVPASMTAISVVEVEVGGRRVAIPRAAIRRIARATKDNLVRSGTGTAICLDDLTVPCAPLGPLLGIASPGGATALFVELDGAIAAVTVDRVLGIDDAVVRTISHAPIDPIVRGLALDPEGQPYPVLEPGPLIAAARGAVERESAPTPARTRVLVVDDSLTTRMLEQSILESAGFEVAVATSAEDGLAQLGKHAFAIVLVDVEMPGMDGFTMISEMRRRPALEKVPAILVTSRDAPEDRRRGEVVGAQGYVVKSEFDQVALLGTIRRLVRA